MKTAVEWLIERIIKRENGYFDGTPVLSLDEIFEQAKQMDKEQRDALLNYIEEVRNLCRKLRFPTEVELREFTDKADVILETFKPEEQ